MHTNPNTLTETITQRVRSCDECGRTFDLLDQDEAAEYFYGHDCEA